MIGFSRYKWLVELLIMLMASEKLTIQITEIFECMGLVEPEQIEENEQKKSLMTWNDKLNKSFRLQIDHPNRNKLIVRCLAFIGFLMSSYYLYISYGK